MRSQRLRTVTTIVLSAAVAGTLVPFAGAHASSEGRRNTAWAATAAAAVLTYQYAQKPSTKKLIPAVAAAGVAGVAWSQANKKRQEELAAERAALVRYGRKTAYRDAGYYRGGSGKVASYRKSPGKKAAPRKGGPPAHAKAHGYRAKR